MFKKLKKLKIKIKNKPKNCQLKKVAENCIKGSKKVESTLNIQENVKFRT